MHETASSAIAPWSNFYVITGSSAAALTGLMFVVITLVAGARARSTHDGISTFSTPTVVNFCAALLLSAILTAPWHSLVPVAVLAGITGLYGVAYTLRVIAKTKRLTTYQPGADDWIWYSILPLATYAIVAAAAILLPSDPTETLFAIAGATIVLIFIGIHNAWDVVTFLVVEVIDTPPSPTPPRAPERDLPATQTAPEPDGSDTSRQS